MGDSIYKYFVSRKTSRGVTLSYLIKNYTPSPEDSENRYVQIIYRVIIVGSMFTIESRKVIAIIKELTLVTDADTWIKYPTCVIKTMQELQDHYDGTSKGIQRKQVARADLKNIFYKNETTSTFEKYITKRKEIFNVLGKYGAPLYED